MLNFTSYRARGHPEFFIASIPKTITNEYVSGTVVSSAYREQSHALCGLEGSRRTLLHAAASDQRADVFAAVLEV